MQQYKSTRVSSLTGSVPRKMAEGRQRVWAPCEHQTHISRLSATRLNHWAINPQVYIDRSIEENRKWLSNDSSYLATLNRFFSNRIVVLGLLRLNIKARHDIPEFLNTNFWLIHLIALDIHWTCEYFHFAQFLLNAHRAGINLRKVRTENLQFRTDLRDRIMDGWSVTLQRQIAPKIFKSKSPLNAALSV